jgi:BASS family bile acid:Na+ symporter
MEATILTEVLLPLALGIIMLGMGLTLTLNDFKQLWKRPKPILLGLLGQIILLPILAFILVSVFKLPPAAAIGLMAVAACPGGTTSNIISHVAKANIALSVSLTAFSTLICIFTTPLIIGFAIQMYEPELMTQFSILKTTIGLFIITLIPISIGMFVRLKARNFADSSEVFFRRFSSLFLAMMIALIVIQEWDTLLASLATLLPSALTLTIGAVFMGYGIGKTFKEPLVNALTLGIEVGIQNATLAIIIAISFLQRPDLATAAGMYGLVMYLGALTIIVFARGRSILKPTEST